MIEYKRIKHGRFTRPYPYPLEDIPYSLLHYGIEKVRMTCGFVNNEYDVRRCRVHTNSIECFPYIQVLYPRYANKKLQPTPLLWAILLDYGVSYSGGCSTKNGGCMQASFTNTSIGTYELKLYTAQEILQTICCNFQVLKDVRDDCRKNR